MATLMWWDGSKEVISHRIKPTTTALRLRGCADWTRGHLDGMICGSMAVTTAITVPIGPGNGQDDFESARIV